MSNRTKVLLGVLAAACVAVVGTCTGGTWLVYSAAQGPENVRVELNQPMRVRTGEKFDIELRVDNLASEPQRLVDIDVAEDYLEGIAIVGSDPPYHESFRSFGMQTFEYDHDIPANSSLTVKMHAEALKPGDFVGDVDVAVGGMLTFVTVVPRTLVEAPDALP
jgi:hypothetical protein